MNIEDFYVSLSRRIQQLSVTPLLILKPETPFFSTGLIDSISIVEVITYVEEYWKVSVEPSELSIENFDSMASIVSYVQKKKG